MHRGVAPGAGRRGSGTEVLVGGGRWVAVRTRNARLAVRCGGQRHIHRQGGFHTRGGGRRARMT